MVCTLWSNVGAMDESLETWFKREILPQEAAFLRYLFRVWPKAAHTRSGAFDAYPWESGFEIEILGVEQAIHGDRSIRHRALLAFDVCRRAHLKGGMQKAAA
jgi:hypothetical protein